MRAIASVRKVAEKDDATNMKMNNTVGKTQPDCWYTIGITRNPGPQIVLTSRIVDPKKEMVFISGLVINDVPVSVLLRRGLDSRGLFSSDVKQTS